MAETILQSVNNLFILILIAIFLYGLACLWAVSADDFNYYFTKLGEFLRKIVEQFKEFVKKDKKKESGKNTIK